MLARDIRLAHRLGFSVMRTKMPVIDEHLFPVDNWREIIKMALPLAEELNIKMCPEVHTPTNLNGKMVHDFVEFIEETGTKNFGINIIRTEKGFYIPGNQKYKPIDFVVEGDWSQAAFFIAAATLSKDKNTSITIEGLNRNSFQGDKAAFEIFSQFGAKIDFIGNDLIVKPGNELCAINLNASQIPDLVPVVAFTAMFAKGTTIISGARRLKLKESDRLISSSLGINCLGGDSRVEPDGITVNGKMKIKGGIVEGFNDHRIVMAASITAVRTDGEIIINDAQSVNKSYPNFFNDYNKLGGSANVIGIW